MAGTDYDVIIGGTQAKILHSEQGGYRRRAIRREIEQNVLSQSNVPALSSRFDTGQMYQTSWAKGSQWWKPLTSPANADAYFQSNNMDVWSEPGKVVPRNKEVNSTDTTDLQAGQPRWAFDDVGNLYAIGRTKVDTPAEFDVYKWTPGSDAFVQEAGYASAIEANGCRGIVFDPSDDYMYVLDASDEVDRFRPKTGHQDTGWITGAHIAGNGSSIMLVPNHGVMVYDGEQLYTLDKDTPALDSVYNDGLGPDAADGVTFGGTPVWDPTFAQFAISTAEGIYYVKNTLTGKGLPVAWIFRVEKDATGSWIGEPIASLPVGVFALDISYHLGSVLLSTTQADIHNLITNDASVQFFGVDIYAVDSQSGLSVLGSPLGGRDEVDESPFALMGSMGRYFFIGGHKRLWLYDAARGGLHTVHEWGTAIDHGAFAMAPTEDSSGNAILLFVGYRNAGSATEHNFNQIVNDLVDDPGTVTNFDDVQSGSAGYTLESNWFDGGLPMETKELTKVAITREGGDGDQEWTVQALADDGSFADVLAHSTTSEIHAEATLSGTTGRKFRYKLVYKTKDTNRKALESLLFTMSTGEMITEWDLMLDGTEMLNIDNEPQDEETFYDAMVTLGNTQAVTTIIDNMQEQEQLTSDSATGDNVKVQAVEIIKEKPGESAIRIILRET